MSKKAKAKGRMAASKLKSKGKLRAKKAVSTRKSANRTQKKGSSEKKALSRRFKGKIPQRIPQRHVFFKGHFFAYSGHHYHFLFGVSCFLTGWDEWVKVVASVIIN